MGHHIDEAKGRTKQAAGDLTDDEKLKREGKIDRAISSVKGRLDSAVESISDKVDVAADKAKDKVGGGRDSRS
jgi:uncharacterized protein YjbJ (UPF0337 family)